MSDPPALARGLVVASHGRHCLVESDDGSRRICHPRGKKNQVVVGDEVVWLPAHTGQGEAGTVEQVCERRNLFYRQDELRTKSFAANLDQVLVLVAAEPEFSEHQLARALIAAEASGIAPLIVLNKQDLTPAFARAWARLTPYRDMGYTVLPLSLRTQPEAACQALLPWLTARRTLVLGPSGAGKSSLINRFVPQAQALTAEISLALNSGKHTTTSTTWYWVETPPAGARTALIDSPGFQEFGLQHLDASQLPTLMPDLRAHAGNCRFYNCTHLHEPGCGIRDAVEPAVSANPISISRYKIYSELHAELSRSRY